MSAPTDSDWRPMEPGCLVPSSRITLCGRSAVLLAEGEHPPVEPAGGAGLPEFARWGWGWGMSLQRDPPGPYHLLSHAEQQMLPVFGKANYMAFMINTDFPLQSHGLDHVGHTVHVVFK